MIRLTTLGLLALAAACSPPTATSPGNKHGTATREVSTTRAAGTDTAPAIARTDRSATAAEQKTANTASPLPDATPTDTANPRSTTRDCYFRVDSRVLVSGRCQVFPMGDDQYTLNTWDSGKPARSHFAVVTKDNDADTTATATWNADPRDDHAMDPLGTVKRDRDCWVNERTRICVR